MIAVTTNEDKSNHVGHVKRVHILMSGALTHGAAGLANSVISRATVLSEGGWEVIILVDVWQPDLKLHVQALVTSRRLSDRVIVRNLYTDLSALSTASGRLEGDSFRSPTLTDYIGGLDQRLDQSDEKIVRYFAENEYKYFGYRRDGGAVSFIDELLDGVRVRRLFFEPAGALIRATIFQGGQVIRDEFFDADGSLYYDIIYDASGSVANRRIKVGVHEYRNLRDGESLLTFWLSSCFEWGQRDVVISEYAFRFDDLEKIKRLSGMTIIYTLHNSHLASPHGSDAPLKPELKATFENAPKMDALVVLTPHQKFDIKKRYPDIENVFVVPHATPRQAWQGTASKRQREDGLIVLVGRLSPIKGQVRVVKEFARVLERCPTARLEIWGRGESEADIAETIDALDLGDSVSLRGFSSEPTQIYQRAEVALFPSLHEGQPLALMEAMQEGCVPVCFDFKYGARMMIDDLIDGVIVERGDVVDLLDSAVGLLEDRGRLFQVSEKAKEKASNFNPSRLREDWETLIELLWQQKRAGQ